MLELIEKHLIAILVIIICVFVALAIINAALPDYTEQIMIDRLSELENKTERLKDVVMELARQKGIDV